MNKISFYFSSDKNNQTLKLASAYVNASEKLLMKQKQKPVPISENKNELNLLI